MSIAREDRLIKEEWQNQATYDAPRISKMVEIYEGIGLEVRLEPFNSEYWIAGVLE